MRWRSFFIWLACGWPLTGCGQTAPPTGNPGRPAKGAAPAATAVPAPQQTVAVGWPADVDWAWQLPDGSRLYTQVARADNQPVPGWARYRPDGQLDTAFCRRAAWAVPHASRVLPAPDGGFWVEKTAAHFGAFDEPELVRLRADGSLDPAFHTELRGSFTAWCSLPGGRLLLGGEYLTAGQRQLGSVACLQADGRLDAAFAEAVGASQGAVVAVLRQRNGRLLVAGQHLVVGSQPAAALLRLTAAGAPDPTFRALPAGAQPLMACALQADDKPLVVLNRGLGTLLRLQPDGTPDPTFNLRLRQPFYIRNGRPPLLVQADGRIVLPGYTSEKAPTDGQPWRSLLRVLPTGEEDLSFHYRAQPDWLSSLQELPQGRLLVVTTPVAYPQEPAVPFQQVTVLDASGGLVPGQVPRQLEQAGYVGALARQPDGQLLLGGTLSSVAGERAGNLARLRLDGTPDTAFAHRCAADGPVTHVVVQPDGRLVVAGSFRKIGHLQRPLLARLLPDGRPDTTFTSPFAAPLAAAGGLDSDVESVATQADGKVLLSGNLKLADGSKTTLLRLLANGRPDATFHPLLTPSEKPGPLLVQPDGRIVVASAPVLLRRLLPDGTVDPGFAVVRHSGIVTALAQYPDGRLLVGGSFGAGGFDGIPELNGLARLLPDGTPDPDFRPPPPSFAFVYGLGVLPDGRLLVGGAGDAPYQNRHNPPYYHLLRLLSTGQPDPAFNLPTGPDGDVGSLVTWPDGTTFVGGSFARPAFGLLRLPAPGK